MCVDDLCSCVCRDLQLSAQPEELKGSVAECADQNCGFCRKLNKTQFCGHNPYTGVNHVISCVVVLCVVSVVFFHALISIYLISKDHC